MLPATTEKVKFLISKKTVIPANIRLDEDVCRLRLQKASSRRLDEDESILINHTSSEDVFVKTNIFVLSLRL